MTDKEMLILNKLEYLKEIKLRMHEMDKLRCKLSEEMDLIGVEERCLSEYRREMDSLYQEKMTHVEELRQIHSDINMLENVLKQSEEDRSRHVDNIKVIHNQMQPLRDVVDKMRSEIGLPRLSDKEHEQLMLDAGSLQKLIDSTEGTGTGKRSYKTQDSSNQDSTGLSSGTTTTTTTNVPSKPSKPFNDNTNLSSSAAAGAAGVQSNNNNPSAASSFSSLASLMSGFQDRSMTGSSSAVAAAAAAHHQTSSAYSRMLMNAGAAAGVGGQGQTGHPNSSSSSSIGGNFHHQDSTTVGGAPTSSISSPAAFRQQPPPMKSCLSCHQQIHRNAPICPLCKAKSRSRHPKRRNNPKN